MQAGTLTNFDIADDGAVHLDLEPEKSRITDGNNLSSFSRPEPKLKSDMEEAEDWATRYWSRLEPKLKSDTNADIDKKNKYRLICTNKKRTKQVSHHQKTSQKNEVDGTIIRVEDISFQCALSLQSKEIIVQLPKIFFPQDVKTGTAFNLSMDEHSGLRRPVVKIRPPKKEKVECGNKALELLISELQ